MKTKAQQAFKVTIWAELAVLAGLRPPESNWPLRLGYASNQKWFLVNIGQYTIVHHVKSRAISEKIRPP